MRVDTFFRVTQALMPLRGAALISKVGVTLGYAFMPFEAQVEGWRDVLSLTT
ncbi:MAG: hypothetical protein QOI53_2568 [Verrucomicrobiota bacterium]|nr:hypothetical protein [Verrucomicrobiota bacterium]